MYNEMIQMKFLLSYNRIFQILVGVFNNFFLFVYWYIFRKYVNFRIGRIFAVALLQGLKLELDKKKKNIFYAARCIEENSVFK